MTITLERYRKDPQDVTRVFYSEIVTDKVKGATAAECMTQIRSMRYNNDLARFTAYEIVDIED